MVTLTLGGYQLMVVGQRRVSQNISLDGSGLGDLRSPPCPALTTVTYVQDNYRVWSGLEPGLYLAYIRRQLSHSTNCSALSLMEYACGGSWRMTAGGVGVSSVVLLQQLHRMIGY